MIWQWSDLGILFLVSKLAGKVIILDHTECERERRLLVLFYLYRRCGLKVHDFEMFSRANRDNK